MRLTQLRSDREASPLPEVVLQLEEDWDLLQGRRLRPLQLLLSQSHICTILTFQLQLK